MPTGYTSKIYNGENVSGKDFLMNCARAFGALISMRDLPSDAEIPEELSPDTYHRNELERLKYEYVDLQMKTVEEIQEIIENEYLEDIEHNKNEINKRIKLKNRYSDTLKKIKNWTPPTSEHEGLKKFAIDQLTESIEWDCDLSYFNGRKILKKSVDEYIAKKNKSYLEDIKYHSDKYKEEIDRTHKRNKWLKDLRDSLNTL